MSTKLFTLFYVRLPCTSVTYSHIATLAWGLKDSKQKRTIPSIIRKYTVLWIQSLDGFSPVCLVQQATRSEHPGDHDVSQLQEPVLQLTYDTCILSTIFTSLSVGLLVQHTFRRGHSGNHDYSLQQVPVPQLISVFTFLSIGLTFTAGNTCETSKCTKRYVLRNSSNFEHLYVSFIPHDFPQVALYNRQHVYDVQGVKSIGSNKKQWYNYFEKKKNVLLPQ
jgi:hypothetical protein